MKVNSTTNEFVYIEETETSEYNTARNAMNFLDVLNNKFIVANKTVAEISEMSDAELESYILDGVDYIDSVYSFTDTGELSIGVHIGIGKPQYNIYHDETHFTSVEFEH